MITYYIGYITCMIYLILVESREDDSWKDAFMAMILILGFSLFWPVLLASWMHAVIKALPLPPKPSSTVECPEPMGKVKEGEQSHD